MEKKTLGYILVAAAIIALVLIVIYRGPQKGLQVTTDTPTSDALIPLKKTDKKIAREADRVSIDVTYPEFEAVPAVINKDIKSFAEGEVANIDSLKLEEVPTMSDAQYFLKANYEIEQANSDFVSLVFTVNIYTGGAHPNEYFKTFNYNVDTGAVITLADLYPDEKDALASIKPKIKDGVHEGLVARLKELADTETDPDSLLFKDVLEQDNEVFQNYTFGTTYIHFFFSPYDIAPYAAGPIEAKVER